MLDGLITFFASHHAIRAEKVLRMADFTVKLIPGPKELSPNCGVALRIEDERRDAATALLTSSKVQVDQVMRYEPRTDAWDRNAPRNRRSRFRR
jgi:hypothetical protein